MIDQSKSSGTDNKYYYYIVTNADEQTGKMLYKFTEFTEMGTFDKKYNNDSSYYNHEGNYVIEKFIVQLNFEDANISGNHSKESIKVQLMDKTDDSVRLTVNDAIYPMLYNLYYNKDAKKSVTIENNETIHLYETKDLNVTLNTDYIYNEVDSVIVYDTTNFDNAEGLKVTFFSDQKQLVGDELDGVSVTYNGSTYTAAEDGSIRFKIADVVCNLEENIKLNLTGKENWDSGTYTVKIEAVASADGINDSNTIASDNLTLIFLSNEYGLDVKLDENSQIIDKATGNTLNGNNTLDFEVKYAAGLANPNIKVALYRRSYKSPYTLEYNLVDLKEFVTNDLKVSNKDNEYIVTDSPESSQKFTLNLKDDNSLKTGTYKVKFLVYDGDTYIGEVYKMIIIK